MQVEFAVWETKDKLFSAGVFDPDNPDQFRWAVDGCRKPSIALGSWRSPEFVGRYDFPHREPVPYKGNEAQVAVWNRMVENYKGDRLAGRR
jgi:hypothetical protein